MPDPQQPWALEGFEERFDTWASDQGPDDDLRIVVAEWVLSRFDDPYQGVWREPDFPNVWFGTVPNSRRGDHVVTCTYRIFEADRRVLCDGFATLGLPV